VTITLLFLACLGVIAAWWLLQQGLFSKPWLETTPSGELPPETVSPVPAAKVGLGVFIAVAGTLFALFISAYSMRMQLADWWSPPAPPILWFNTGVLIVSSGALEWAKWSARGEENTGLRAGLTVASIGTLVFLIGQVIAWRQLESAGYFLSTNPGNSFFYLITGAHAVHVVGGLIALGMTADKVRRVSDSGEVRLSIELCAIYWHFLLLVWLVLLALLTGWASDFVALCRGLLT
jgi:cytochrome c oxidase subunit III